MTDIERTYVNALINLLHEHDVNLTEELEIGLQRFVETMIEEVEV
jgi:hypothetical protein